MRELLILLGWLALSGCERQTDPVAPAEKPELALLTSLPIIFGEDFTLEAPANPLLDALEDRYRVQAVDGPEQLKPAGLLLAIQPQALTAERLVALDRWVNDGGRLVLLADPELKWESSRPLGDRFRPPFSFPDTGLLARWGLRLEGGDGEQPAPREVAPGVSVATSAPGRLAATDGRCRVQQRFLAFCRIGKGLVVVAADADFTMTGSPADLEGLRSLIEAARRG